MNISRRSFFPLLVSGCLILLLCSINRAAEPQKHNNTVFIADATDPGERLTLALDREYADLVGDMKEKFQAYIDRFPGKFDL